MRRGLLVIGLRGWENGGRSNSVEFGGFWGHGNV